MAAERKEIIGWLDEGFEKVIEALKNAGTGEAVSSSKELPWERRPGEIPSHIGGSAKLV